MIFAKHDRNGILLLFEIALLFIFVSIGCLQSNKSKIVGSWKVQSIDNIDRSGHYTLYNFYKDGIVSKKTEIKNDEQLSKPINKMIGKYKFEEDQINISISWGDGNLEKMNVSFPEKNKMLLGKYEMEKIK